MAPKAKEIISEIPAPGVRVPGPSGTVIAPQPVGQGMTLRADPTTEYVSGGQYSYTATYLRSLPFAIDDVSSDLGDDLYDRMLHDAQVSSCVNSLKMGILAQGVTVVSAKGERDENFDQAKEVSDFCQRCFDNLKTPLIPTLYDMLDALALGNRVAELVYDDGEGDDAGKLVLVALKTKPRRAVSFVVDAYTNVVGLLGLIPGQGAPILYQSFIPIGSYGAGGGEAGMIPNLLPVDKFAILTFRPKNNDPRGQSILRSAYTPWNFKMQIWGDYLQYLALFASPKTIGITADGAMTTTPADAAGNITTDINGLPLPPVTPETAMLSSLIAFRNATAAAFPFGSDVKLVQAQGEGGAFLSAFDLLDRQISKAITGQTLATGEAEHQALAASQTHENILGSVVQFGKYALAVMLERVLKLLVQINYPPEMWKFAPRVSLSETGAEDMALNWTAAASLYTAGYLTPSQLPDMDAKLGLPMRSQEDQLAMQAKQDQAQAAGDQAIQAPASTGQPSGSDQAAVDTADPPQKQT